jgi:hypothetical protein
VSFLIGTESFKRMAKIVKVALPGASGLALCNESGKPKHYIDFDKNGELLLAIKRLSKKRPSWASTSAAKIYGVNGRTILTASLANERKDPIATLAILA